MKFSSGLIFASVLGGISGHVTANPSVGVEGTYFVSAFRVPHGCGNSSTSKVIINYDTELVKAGGSFTPQDLAGWKSSIVSEGGETPNSEGVSELGTGESSSAVIYSEGDLPYNMYTEFGISFKLPLIASLPASRNGTLYFGVDQQCKNGEWQNWTTPGDKKYPPPEIKLTTAEANAKSGCSMVLSSMPLLIAGFMITFFF